MAKMANISYDYGKRAEYYAARLVSSVKGNCKLRGWHNEREGHSGKDKR